MFITNWEGTQDADALNWQPRAFTWHTQNLHAKNLENRFELVGIWGIIHKKCLNLQKEHLYGCRVVFIFRVISWLKWAQAHWKMLLKHLPYIPLPLDMPWECWHKNRKSAGFTRTPRQVSHGGSLTFRRPGKRPVCTQHVHPVYACIQVHQIYYACVDHLIYCQGLLPGAARPAACSEYVGFTARTWDISKHNHLSSWAFLGGNTGTMLKLLDSLWFCTCLQAETLFWDNVNATTLAYF